MNTLRFFIFASSLLTAVACSKAETQRAIDSASADSVARARQDSINRTLPGYVVDSILPIEEEMRRFDQAIGGHKVARLANGETSRGRLIRTFVDALNHADTAKLRAMSIAPREFADLIYPESPYTRTPYRQSPALVWDQIENGSVSGLTRLLRRASGLGLKYRDYSCKPTPDVQGHNKIWTDCVVTLRRADGTETRADLFGSIIERDGMVKFVSYTNSF